MSYAICIVGSDEEHNQDLARELGRRLAAAGLKVGMIQAGGQPKVDQGLAGEVRLGPGGMVVQSANGAPMSLEQIMGRYLPGLDLVLTLAHPDEKRAKIEVVPAGAEPVRLEDPGLKALVCPQPLEVDKPVFGPDQVEALADFVREKVMPRRQPARVRVLLEGKRLPIKDFVQDILANTIRGMVGSLRGGNKPGRLEIYIEAD